MAGTLYGIGLGPGDPDYMTVRARRILETAPVLAHFARRGRRGNARTIADAVAREPAHELALIYPVTTEIPVEDPIYGDAMTPFYEESAARLAAELDRGRDVGLLCEGDPFFYGSFMHLWRRLKDRYPVEVIPGVSGMSGCWTRAGVPITWGDDVLTVLPATLPKAEILRRLALTDAAVFMKLGRHFGKVREALAETGMLARAVYVERGTMTDERIAALADLPADHEAPYFAIVLVPGQGRRL